MKTHALFQDSVRTFCMLAFGLAFNPECLAGPHPVITGFSPQSGPPGVTVSIFGRKLSGVTSVSFNGVAAASFTVVSAKKVAAVVPLAASTGPIFVTTPAGMAASGRSFVVEALTLTVTSPADSGAGSLREAIDLSNATANVFTNHILFSIGSGSQSISVRSALPNLMRPVQIDGTTQPSYAGAPLIELNGAMAGNANGLVFFSGNSVVRGLVINRFAASGILLNAVPGTRPYGKGNYVVEGCFIGTDPSGTVALGNGTGVAIDAGTNRIGGTAPSASNLISGNGNAGILMRPFVRGTVVQGNFIGTDVTGTAALGNGRGISILLNSEDNVIGGTQAGAGNLISGNTLLGLELLKADYTTIQGNFIGTDRSGSVAIPNGVGVIVSSSSCNLIGGTVERAANLISGNIGHGIVLHDDPEDPRFTIGNVVQGNRIGTDGAGNATLGNGGDGVAVGCECPSPASALVRYNPINANAIAGNGGLGINLYVSDLPSGVTPNDPGDADSGPNNAQNFPFLISAISSGGSTTISGTLNSMANADFVIELFSSLSADPSGNGEGQFYLGSVSVTANANGDANFSFTTNLSLSGQVATATARDLDGNTSEFSLALAIQ